MQKRKRGEGGARRFRKLIRVEPSKHYFSDFDADYRRCILTLVMQHIPPEDWRAMKRVCKEFKAIGDIVFNPALLPPRMPAILTGEIYNGSDESAAWLIRDGRAIGESNLQDCFKSACENSLVRTVESFICVYLPETLSPPKDGTPPRLNIVNAVRDELSYFKPGGSFSISSDCFALLLSQDQAKPQDFYADLLLWACHIDLANHLDVLLEQERMDLLMEKDGAPLIEKAVKECCDFKGVDCLGVLLQTSAAVKEHWRMEKILEYAIHCNRPPGAIRQFLSNGLYNKDKFGDYFRGGVSPLILLDYDSEEAGPIGWRTDVITHLCSIGDERLLSQWLNNPLVDIEHEIQKALEACVKHSKNRIYSLLISKIKPSWSINWESVFELAVTKVSPITLSDILSRLESSHQTVDDDTIQKSLLKCISAKNKDQWRLVTDKYEADLSRDSNQILRSILLSDVVEIFGEYVLLDARVDLTVHDNLLFHRLCSQPNCSSLLRDALQDPRIDPTWEDSICLSWAVNGNNHTAFQLLLTDKRADPSSRNNLLIRETRKKGMWSFVNVLMHDTRVNPDDYPSFEQWYTKHFQKK